MAKKKKSIIRFEAIIPTLIIFLLLSLYFVFFFDKNMKSALEWTLTRAHGAEVNIGSFKSKIKTLSLEINDVQFTYDQEPTKNVVQFNTLSLNFLWDAILQAKYIIPQAELKNIQTMIPRKSPGRVLPQAERTGYRGMSNNIKEQIKEQVDGNIVSDLMAISQGTDVNDQLKNIQYDLKTDQKVKQLEKELKQKEAEWKERIEKLPKKEDLKEYESRLKGIKLKSKNIKDIAKQLKDASSLVKDVKGTIKNFEDTSKDLKSDVSNYKKEIGNIDNLIKEDLASIKKKLKLPSLDSESISKGIFFPIIESKLLEFKRYISMAQSYFPKSEKKEGDDSESISPPERGSGKNYYFPKKSSYPKFWLKKANISSTTGKTEYSGNFKGKITNITNNPKHLGLPIIATIKGDIPKQQITGIDALITVDHTGDKPVEKMEFTVGGYPAKNLILSKSSGLSIEILKSLLNSKITAFHSNNNIKFKLDNQFNKADYKVDAKSSTTQKLVMQTLNEMAALTLNGSIEGTWKKFKLSLNSNLGKELENAIKGKIKGKIKEAEEKLKSKIFGGVNESKKKLQNQFDKFSISSLGELKNREDYLKKIKDEAGNLKNAKPSLKNIDKKELKDKGKKLLKDLFD